MKTIPKVVILTVFFLLIAVFCVKQFINYSTGRYFQPTESQIAAEDQLEGQVRQDILDTLKKGLSTAGIKYDWTIEECINYWVFDYFEEDKFWTVELHEKHDSVCPGDPSTSPLIDTYRVDKKSKGISKLDRTTGSWLPLK